MVFFSRKSEYAKRKERIKEELENQEVVDNEEEDVVEQEEDEEVSGDDLEDFDKHVLNFLNEKYPNKFFVDTNNATEETWKKKKNNTFYEVTVWVYDVYTHTDFDLLKRKLVFVSKNEIYFMREK